MVVKVGGAVGAEAAATILALAAADEVCVVHGAGPQISRELTRLGLPVRFVGGRRVTSVRALEVVRRSLSDVNAALCASRVGSASRSASAPSASTSSATSAIPSRRDLPRSRTRSLAG